MKKLFALLLSLAGISSASFAQNRYDYDLKNFEIKNVIVNAGNSKIFSAATPFCFLGTEEKCPILVEKALFNCKSEEIYSLGSFTEKEPLKPKLQDTFRLTPELNPLTKKLKTLCSQKPAFQRSHIYLAEGADLTGFFLISDTATKNRNVISAWIEELKFKKELPPAIADMPEAEVQEWMYMAVLDGSAESKKQHWQVNCSDRTTTTTAFYKYSSKGQLIDSAQVPSNDFYPVVPGSVGEAIMQNLCAMF